MKHSSATPATLPPAANFSDALRRMGHPFQTLDPAIRPVFVPVRLTGEAFPVQCYAGATWALEQAIEAAPEGSVLVVDGGGYDGAVLMGGLMSLRARMRRLAGAVIDGAVRDTLELRKAEWPIFARATTPNAGTHDQQGAWNLPVSCGNVIVHPGDRIVADDDGAVVIPAALWPEAEREARAVEAREAAIEAHLRQGLTLAEAVERIKGGMH